MKENVLIEGSYYERHLIREVRCLQGTDGCCGSDDISHEKSEAETTVMMNLAYLVKRLAINSICSKIKESGRK